MATNKDATLVPWWLIDRVTAKAVSVYVALDKINKTTGWTSVAAVSEASGLSNVTVVRAIRELEAVGAAKSQVRFADGGGRMPNSYVLAIDAPFEGEPVPV